MKITIIKNMTTFTKWFLLNAIVLTACFFAEQHDAISHVIRNDLSHISIVIMILYFLVSAFVGRLCYSIDKSNGDTIKDIDERDKIEKRSDLGWFAAEHFFSLGLLGTILGLTIATQTSLQETVSVSEIVGGLKSGLNTAFYTTICGIVFSLPLQIQLMILKHKLDEY